VEYDIVKQYLNEGLALVIAIMVLIFSVKYIPEMIKNSRARQEKFEELLSSVIKATQQGNAVMGNNTAAMEKNTEAFKSIEQVVNKVDNSVNRVMGNVESAINRLDGNLTDHCRAVDGIRIGVEKLLERSDKK
jgi:hypothetical protein